METHTEKKAYLDAILVNLFSIQKKCELLSIPIVVLPFVYFLINERYIDTIEVAYFIIKQEKLRLILILIPALYALSIIFYLLYSFNRNQLHIDYKKTVYELNEENAEELDKIIQNILPFNIWLSLSKITEKDTWVENILAVLMLPLIFLLFLPVWFSYYSCSRIYTEFWSISLLSKISFFTTVWLWLIISFFMLKLFFDHWNEK